MEDIDEILKRELTEEQYNAATATSSEVLCLACAGSGKSRTLAYRIAWFIANGADPSGIVAFTFTEKAAESIKLNIAHALESAGLQASIMGAMYIGTIHSYCQHILHEMHSRYRQYDVLDENRFKLYLISRYPQLGLHRIRAERNNARYFQTVNEVANAWTIANSEMIGIDEIAEDDPTLGEILNNIESSLRRDEFIDFSSMIWIAVNALQSGDTGAERAVRPLQHLMVDEYQDVNPLQEKLIRLLHERSETLLAVGDDDQSIYAWRGADVRNILTFQDRYPSSTIYTLSINFRSTSIIVSTADAFAAAELGATRYVKNPTAADDFAPKDFGVMWFDVRSNEAEWIARRVDELLGMGYRERDGTIRGLTPADFAILMRSTRTSEQDDTPRHQAFTRALEQRNIAYSLEAGGSIFDRPQVDVLRGTFGLLRDGSPNRDQARAFFDTVVLANYPNADFHKFAAIMATWGRSIHAPIQGSRRRVYPQQLVHDLADAFQIAESNFDDGTMQDIGAFSKMIQDIEMVYMSIDTKRRFQEILNFMQNIAESGYDTGSGDILRRPDAVTVSTVHKVKGLEFPVVFVVDVEHLRFPGRRSNYNGWLPRTILQEAIQRNAYIGTREAESRLFYTAITRAERFLYVTGSEMLPGGRRPRTQSPFALRLNTSGIHSNINAMPVGLTQCEPDRRIDETVIPTSYSDIRYYLKCPKDYQLRKIFGFSPHIVDMFGFGQTVHASICRLHELYTASAPSIENAAAVAQDIFHLKHVPQSGNPDSPGPYERARESAERIARNYVQTYSEDFARRRQLEARFEIPLHQAVISGSIDLMLHEDASGRLLDASVIDFKAMEGGEVASENESIHWTELALQVQLYAKAAQDVLGQNARVGAVHLLKDNQRINVPIDENAVDAAIGNIEWAVDRIISGDFPMRPKEQKCQKCDFQKLCVKTPGTFNSELVPPPIHIPGDSGTQMARAFSEFEDG